MTSRLPVLILCAGVWTAGPAPCADHLLGPAAAQERLAAAAAAREHDVRVLDRALASPAAASAARALGTRVASLKAGVRTLSEGELRDLAARAAALDADPLAGEISDHEVRQALVVFLIVAMVVIVLNAAG